MRNRLTKFIIDDETEETREVNKGLPQGEVLSLTLYNLYTRSTEISKGIQKDIRILQYADDITLYTTDKDINKCKIKIRKVINQINENLLSIGLDIEPSKTNIIIFNNKKDKDKVNM